MSSLTDLVAFGAEGLLLDRLDGSGDGYVRCSGVVSPESCYVHDGCVREVVLLEYMAQTVAVCAGLEARGRGESPSVGYLIGCHEAHFHCDTVAVGQRLSVDACREWGRRVMGRFRCSVSLPHEGTSLAEATLTVALPHAGGNR